MLRRSHASAVLLSLALSPLAAAATYGGFTASTGAIRCATGVNQVSDATVLATAVVEIDYCSGFTEVIPFAMVSLSNAEAVGTFARVDAFVSSATSTIFKLSVTNANDAVAGFRILGGPSGTLGFDKATPNPGTAGSNTGANISPTTMVGAWTVYAMFTDAVALCPSLPRNDLFSSLHMRFTTCFRFGDALAFRVDTDKLY